VLGPEALQSGSYNKPGYLRLDFAWDQALSAATRSELEEVANRAVRQDLPVRVLYGSMQEAQAMGAIALFGETYDDTVRIVEIGGPWSVELCGGTHVERTSQIGLLSLLGESSVGSGLRGVEAFVSADAFAHLARERALVSGLADLLKVQPDQLTDRVAKLVAQVKAAEKEIANLRTRELLGTVPSLVAAAETVGGYEVVARHLPGTPADDLRTLALEVRNAFGGRPGVVALVGGDAKPVLLVATTEAARGLGAKAGALVGAGAVALGGRGGGRDDLAQGGGTSAEGAPQALAAIRSALAG